MDQQLLSRHKLEMQSPQLSNSPHLTLVSSDHHLVNSNGSDISMNEPGSSSHIILTQVNQQIEMGTPNLTAHMLMRKKYTELHINLKMCLIDDFEKNKYSQRSLANKYNVSKTAVQRILSQRDEIRKLAGTPQTLKRKRQMVYSDIDHHVLEWYKSAKKKKIPISGPRLQAKALEIAKTLNIEDFTASNGWLNRFKKRHVPFMKDQENHVESIEEWLTNVNHTYQGYAPENIYNFDETSLYFRNILPKSAGIQIDKTSGKERLSLCFLCNSLGGKEIPLIIGRNKNPACFKNIDVENVFNISWRSDVYGGLSYEIFEEYLLKFDENLRYQNRHIILFLDNTITCQLDLQFRLTNIKLEFFPGKIADRIEPLYLGILKTLKHFYRNEGMAYVSDPSTMLPDEEVIKKISLLDACSWISKAWQNISPIIIQSCFRKAGLLVNGPDIDYESASFIDACSSSSDEEENFISCTEFVQTPQPEEIDPNYEIQFYHHLEKAKKKNKKKTNINHLDALNQLIKIKKLAESSKGSETLKKHIESSIEELEKIIEDRKFGVQSKITQFFKVQRRQAKTNNNVKSEKDQ